MIRVGHGYDVHRLVPGRRLVLGGVELPFDRGLEGHSDADVLVHAVIDALLGAVCAGDIGGLFPDSDSRYKDISSLKLLAEVRALMEKNSYALSNLDATVVAEAPRLAPYIPQMRANIASALGAEAGSVSVKATTEESLGFTGRGEGIAAHCVCLIEKS